MQAGERVTVIGLIEAVELNGRHGKVIKMEDRGRVLIELDGGEEEEISLRCWRRNHSWLMIPGAPAFWPTATHATDLYLFFPSMPSHHTGRKTS